MNDSVLRWFAIAAIFTTSGFGMADSNSAVGQVTNRTITQPNDSIEILIPSVAGQIRWADVASELGNQLRLDANTISQMFPDGSIDMRSGATMLTLIGINLAAGDAIAFGVEYGKDGNEILKVRCRRDLLGGRTIAAVPQAATFLIDHDWITRTQDKPLVVFLHGMNSGPDAYGGFRASMRREGFATAAVGYDYRQSISDSAKQVSLAFAKTMPVEAKRPRVCVVGHSMGGLVGLEWIENPGLDHVGVDQLITVGTPHAGSNWASLPPLSDMFTNAGFDSDDLVDVILHRPSADGVADLIPGSDFLQTVQSRKRRAGVRYTCVAGNVSPMEAEQLGSLRQSLKALDQEGSMMRLIRPRIAPLMDSFEEMEAGKGDGIVSVKSACLAGVPDCVEVSVSHFEMVVPESQVEKNPIFAVILDRLK